MIDGRPAAAALIKKSRRVGMTAFLGWISGVRLMLTIAIACKIQDRSFRLCWQGESAPRAPSRGSSWQVGTLTGCRAGVTLTGQHHRTLTGKTTRVEGEKPARTAARSSVIGGKVEIFCSV